VKKLGRQDTQVLKLLENNVCMFVIYNLNNYKFTINSLQKKSGIEGSERKE
jgi:hypothetical protein